MVCVNENNFHSIWYPVYKNATTEFNRTEALVCVVTH